MLASLLFSAMLLQTPAAGGEPPAKPGAVPSAPAASASPGNSVSAKQSGVVDRAELLKVNRIFVDSFGDDIISKEMQSMIVSALVESKRFHVTENRARADAILKGIALEKTSPEVHVYGEGTAVGTASGAHSGSIDGSIVNGNGTISGSSSGGFAAHSMATEDSSLNTETVNEARIAMRLVNPDGDFYLDQHPGKQRSKVQGVKCGCCRQVCEAVASRRRETGERHCPGYGCTYIGDAALNETKAIALSPLFNACDRFRKQNITSIGPSSNQGCCFQLRGKVAHQFSVCTN